MSLTTVFLQDLLSLSLWHGIPHVPEHRKVAPRGRQAPDNLLEDVFVTGILAARAGIRPLDHPGFSYSHRKLEPCSVTRTVTTHRVGPGKMVDLWKSIKKMKRERKKACLWREAMVTQRTWPWKVPLASLI